MIDIGPKFYAVPCGLKVKVTDLELFIFKFLRLTILFPNHWIDFVHTKYDSPKFYKLPSTHTPV